MKTSVQKATIIIAAAAEVTPAKVPNDELAVVEAVQTKLRSLGYVNAGPPDGKYGEKTQSAILDFRNRNDLPTGTGVDGELLNALLIAPPKVLPLAQTVATEAQIAPKVQAAKSNLWSRFWAKVTAIPSVAAAVALGIINNLAGAVEALTPVKTFLQEWLDGIDKITLIAIATGATALVSGVLWVTSRHTGEAITQGYRDGTVVNDKDAS